MVASGTRHILFLAFAFSAAAQDLSPSCDNDDSTLMQLNAAAKREKGARAEKETFPDMGNWNDQISKITEAAKKGDINDLTKQVKDVADGAVSAGKSMALEGVTAAVKEVNATLDQIGAEIQEANATAKKFVAKMQQAVAKNKDKAKAFVASAKNLLGKATVSVKPIVDGLKSIQKAADQGLGLLGQKEAAKAFDAALGKCFASLKSWQSNLTSMEAHLVDLANTSLSMLAEDPLLMAEDLMVETDAPKDVANAASNLALQLEAPMQQLSSAASALTDLSEDAYNSFESFVEGGLEAAKAKLPADLVSNATEILKGVQAKASATLLPLGPIADTTVASIYDSANEAGVSIPKSGTVSLFPSLLPMLMCLLLLL
mmetsp:Transcript_23443/g.42308  ORF Transcript_23443/g.42308 Transcript_23443/m.42308 type:complete len:373 (-) Transcript_23443:43-1161(-)